MVSAASQSTGKFDISSFFIALRMSTDPLSIVYGLKPQGPFEETLWQRVYYGERNT
jgi:hypothetical protein